MKSLTHNKVGFCDVSKAFVCVNHPVCVDNISLCWKDTFHRVSKRKVYIFYFRITGTKNLKKELSCKLFEQLM